MNVAEESFATACQLFPGRFAVSATAYWLPWDFGFDRSVCPGSFAATACQIRRKRLHGQLAVSATACWFPRGFGWHRLDLPGSFAATDLPNSPMGSPVCNCPDSRVPDRLLQPTGELSIHRFPDSGGSLPPWVPGWRPLQCCQGVLCHRSPAFPGGLPSRPFLTCPGGLPSRPPLAGFPGVLVGTGWSFRGHRLLICEGLCRLAAACRPAACRLLA